MITEKEGKCRCPGRTAAVSQPRSREPARFPKGSAESRSRLPLGRPFMKFPENLRKSHEHPFRNALLDLISPVRCTKTGKGSNPNRYLGSAPRPSDTLKRTPDSAQGGARGPGSRRGNPTSWDVNPLPQGQGRRQEEEGQRGEEEEGEEEEGDEWEEGEGEKAEGVEGERKREGNRVREKG